MNTFGFSRVIAFVVDVRAFFFGEMLHQTSVVRDCSLDCDDAIISMFNEITKKLTYETKVELIGSAASQKLNHWILQKYKWYAPFDSLHQDDNVTEQLHYKKSKPHDIDIRVESHAVAKDIMSHLQFIADTTRLMRYHVIVSPSMRQYSRRRGYVCFANLIRLDMCVANTTNTLVDISWPDKDIYALNDFVVRAKMLLGSPDPTPTICAEPLVQWKHKDFWLSWMSGNNELLIPNYQTWCDIRKVYPKTPGYFEMLYNQLQRWCKHAARLTPNPGYKNHQEYLKNMINQHVTMKCSGRIQKHHQIEIQCHHCLHKHKLHHIVRNRNIFAQHVIIRNNTIYIRCMNTKYHMNQQQNDNRYNCLNRWKNDYRVMYSKQSLYHSPRFQCSICFTHPINLQLKCGHIFCKDCVDEWSNSSPNSKCPECKEPLYIARHIDGDRIVEEKKNSGPIPSFDKVQGITNRAKMYTFPVGFHLNCTREQFTIDLPILQVSKTNLPTTR